MKNPSFRTWLLGSRFTAPPILLGAGWYTWQWWQAGGGNNTGLISIALMGVSAKATYEVNAYRRWRADWRAMAPGSEAQGRRKKPATIVAILGVVLVGAAMIWASSPDAPAQVRSSAAPMALLGAMLGVALAIMRRLGRMLRSLWARWKGNQSSKRPAVTLVIKRPLLRVPPIPTCYNLLPPHCQMLLKGGKS